MNRFNRTVTSMLTVTALCFGTASLAEKTPTAVGSDARIAKVYLQEGDVGKIGVSMLYLTTFEFGNGEKIRSYALGDSESFLHEKSKGSDFLLIKALVPHAGTNLIVYTDRNDYIFEIVTLPQNARKTFKVSVNPPKRVTQTVDKARTVEPSKVVFRDYHAAGNKSLKPLSIWDDGVNTYMKFSRNRKRPAIFKTDNLGYDMATNSAQISRNVVKIEGTSKFWTLKIGSEVICIVRGPLTAAQQAKMKARLAKGAT